jgi:NHL repeat-containing protein
MSTAVAPSYKAIPGWERIPSGFAHPDVAAVAVDSKDRVFLFCRSEHPVMIYERDGRFVGSWGEGIFTMRTHGITIGPDDSVYCTDDAGHSVRKFTPDGKLLLTLGDNAGKPSDTGYNGSDPTTVARAAPPFNRPTNLAVASNGDLYVSDGYGNACTASRRTGSCSRRGASQERDPGNSCCRTASLSMGQGTCSSAIAKATAYRYSPRRVASFERSSRSSVQRRSCSRAD